MVKKNLISVLLAVFMVPMFTGCESSSSATVVAQESQSPESSSEQVDLDNAETNNVTFSTEADIPEYKIGETWVVDNNWEFTITGVTETDLRSDFSNHTPAAVYIIDYTYKNLGFEAKGLGLMMYATKGIVDCKGKPGYNYPEVGEIKFPQTIAIGETCNAQNVIGVDHAGNFYTIVKLYDAQGNFQKVRYYLEVK